MLKLSVCVSGFLVFVAFKRRRNPIVFYPWNYSVLHTHRKKRASGTLCADRSNNVTVVLVVVVDVAITEVHVPHVVAVVLSRTPVVRARKGGKL